MERKTFFVAVAILVFAPLVFAESPADAAGRYVPFAVKDQIAITNLSSASGHYYLVFLSGNASFVLSQGQSDYALVSDRSTLASVLSPYADSQFTSAFNSTSLAKLNADFSALATEFKDCQRINSGVIQNQKAIYFFGIYDDYNSKVKLSKLAFEALGSDGSTDNEVTQTAAALDRAQAVLSGVKVENGAEATKSGLLDLNATLSGIYDTAKKFDSDFNLITARHPEMVHRKICKVSTLMGPVFGDISPAANTATLSEMVDSLSNVSSSHLDLLSIRQMSYNLSFRYFNLRGRYRFVSDEFSQNASISLSSFGAQIDAIGPDVDALKASESLEQAKAPAASATSKMDAADRHLDYLESALPAIINATSQVQLAGKTGLPGASGLSDQLGAVKSGVESGKEVPLSDIESLAANASSMASGNSGQGSSSGGDLIFAGIVFVLIVGAAAFLITRKRRKMHKK